MINFTCLYDKHIDNLFAFLMIVLFAIGRLYDKDADQAIM